MIQNDSDTSCNDTDVEWIKFPNRHHFAVRADETPENADHAREQ